MILGIPRESFPGERRGAVTPLALAPLAAGGFEVVVASGAGGDAGFPGAAYRERGARVRARGDGVAGLQAIATARRLGAVVEAYDVRPAVKEQVESLGARFVELPLETDDAEQAGGYAREMGEDFYRRQRELLGEVLSRTDALI